MDEPPAKRLRTRKSLKDFHLDQERNEHYKPGSVSVECLGDDLLLSLFAYLDIKTLFTHQRVCKRWRKVFRKYCKQIRKVDYSTIYGRRCGGQEGVDAMMSVAKECPNVRVLDFSRLHPFAYKGRSGSKLFAKHIQLMKRFCSELRELDVSGMTLADSAFVKMRGLTGLQVLKMNNINVPLRQTRRQIFQKFLNREPLPPGASLPVFKAKMTHLLSPLLGSLKNLQSLDLVGLDSAGQGFLSCLGEVNREALESLDISHNRVIQTKTHHSPEGAKDDGQHQMDPDLTDVFMKEWPALKHLAAVKVQPKLESVESGNGGFSVVDGIGEFLGLLHKSAPNLESLHLTGAIVKESDVRTLARLPHLRKLSFGSVISYGDRTDRGAGATESLLLALSEPECECRERLEFLDLSQNRFKSQETWKLLAHFPQLAELILVARMCREDPVEPLLDDHILGVIVSGCRKLNKITLRGFPRISDAGIASIGSYCPLVTYLDVVSCSKVYSQGLSALAEGLKSSDARPEKLGITVYTKGCMRDGPPLKTVSLWDLMTVKDSAPDFREGLDPGVPSGEPWDFRPAPSPHFMPFMGGLFGGMVPWDSDSDDDDSWDGGPPAGAFYNWEESSSDEEGQPECSLM